MSETPRAPHTSNNSDLYDLKYRISQLEHLFVNSSLNSTSPNLSSLQSSELRSIQTQHELIERISDLEGLLAASELENRNLRQELAILDMDKKRDDVILLEKLYAKDQEVQRLQNEVKLLETKLGKSEKMIENVKEYINSLPSQEELDEAKDNIVRLGSDNHVLRQKVSSLGDQVRRQEQEIQDRNRKIQEQNLRLEEIQPLEEAQSTILQRSEEGSINFQDEKVIKELITVQKAQILRSAKLISSLREKLNVCQKEKGELQGKISSQGREVERLQEELMVIQLTLEKTTQKMKSLEQEKLCLLEEKSRLEGTLEERENFIKQRDTQFNNIIRLVTEIDLCVTDVKKLVELGECIARGEEPPVTSLLGLSDELEMHLQSFKNEDESLRLMNRSGDEGEEGILSSTSCNNNSNSSGGPSGSSKNENSLAFKYLASFNNRSPFPKCEEFSLGNMEWVLDRIKRIRDLRQSIGLLRDQVNDLYTDMIGDKVEGCAMQ